MDGGITYGRVEQLLKQLNFTPSVEATRRLRAYRHRPSQVLVLLGGKPASAPVGEDELDSVRRHLSENGILAPEAFETWRAA